MTTPLPPNVKDISGQTFGKLTVIAYVGVIRGKHSWACRCICGGEKVAVGKYLSAGNTTSCGCTREQNARHLGLKRGGRKYGSIMLSQLMDSDDEY